MLRWPSILTFARAENVDERAIVARSLVEAVERAQGHFVARIFLETRLPRFDRGARIVEGLVRQVADLREELAFDRDVALELRLQVEDLQELAAATSRFEDAR